MAIPAKVITDVPLCIDGTLNYTPLYVKVAAALTSVLSMLGSIMIILSYICFKQMRTSARRILLHLSLMDFFVGFANFFGTVVDFNVLINLQNKSVVQSQHREVVEGVCVAQGALALFANTSSILWTIAIAVHIYLSLMQSFAKLAANCYWIVCYGFSSILTVWFVATGKLGPAPVSGSWCSVLTTGRDGHINVFFGSNMWVYIAFIVVPVVSFSLIAHSKQQLVPDRHMSSRSLVRTLQSVESKLLAIPIIFVVLRVWSLVLLEMKLRTTVPCPVILSLLFVGSIGDSGQGFFNAIIYCVFNQKVRQAYFNLFCCNSTSRQCCRKHDEKIPIKSAKESMDQIN